ncbi:MAG: hypothetical protein P8J91_15825 [Pirellulaceae bacterium]|nr:hypothetical protein [Pirellulaceae bacterium]MDG2105220.1 hypothetical protein [Pirellulaceae bacterium]
MKKTLVASLSIFMFGVLSISQITLGGPLDDETKVKKQPAPVSVLQSQPVTPALELPVQEPEASPSDVAPAAQPAPQAVAPVTAAPVMAAPVPTMHHQGIANSCGCCNVCDCPVPTIFVLVDDCGCPHEVCIEIPPCCVGIAPVIKWRNGILGRKIAKLCWPCCKKRARVVIPANGDPKVWD